MKCLLTRRINMDTLKSNFEKFYKSYNLDKLNNLNLLYESDEEDTNGDLKQFSNSLKQFLKSKRALSK